jgi:hypothetical protein
MSAMTEPRSAQPHQRVSPEEREAAAERIRQAAGEGRLTLDELDARLEAALSALTFGELDAVLGDLPAPVVRDTAAAPEVTRLAVSHGHLERVGGWRLPRRLEVELGFASGYLDLRTSPMPSGGMEVAVQAFRSKLVLVVPADAVVDTDEVGRHRGKIVRRGGADAGGGGPVVRITGDLRRSKLFVKRPS